MKIIHSLCTIGLVSILMVGCSNTTRSYVRTIQLAFEDRSASYTIEEVSTSKADLIQIKAGERDTASLALAYIEGDKYRWVSGDKVVFTMHHGVIVQTEGLGNDLYYTSKLMNNPLAGDNKLAYEWLRKVDIEGVGYGLPVSSSWRIQGEVTQQYMGYPVNVLKITETVHFPDTTPFIDTGLTWENTYFLDAKSKELLASSQKFSPKGDVYDMVYLSRVVRLLKRRGVVPQ
jgi:hypothetical protein